MGEHQVLFCPFCRESFEGLRACPEHEIELVSFDKLAPDPLADDGVDEAEHEVTDDTRLDAFEPRYGRAVVCAGALLNALAFGLECVRGVSGSAGLTTRELAITMPSLWTLLLVSFTLLYVLARRRTPRSLRSMRVLVPLLALVSPATVAWAVYRLHQGAVVWATGGRTIGLGLGVAVYLVVAAGALTFAGGAALGVLPRAEASRR